MKILIKEVTLVKPGSSDSGSVHDVLIIDGIIQKIATPGSLSLNDGETIHAKNKYLSAGWFDLHVNFREPGYEYKEDLKSGCKAAAEGGFTGVLCMPSTFPPIHTKSEVEFVLNKTKNELVEVHVAGTLSHQREGKDLSEMYDMSTAGAIAFTDDKRAVQDAGLMTRALLYAKNFGGRIFSFADDCSLSAKGQMNEGVTSTTLGLKGIPSIAEEVMISRDLQLTAYTESAIHFSTITTKAATNLIREAKLKGLKVSADVSALHLAMDDSELSDFNTMLKVKPPLRTSDDIEALIEALNDGTISAICSDHSPEDPENKVKEFDLAAFGASGLETAFGAACKAIEKKVSLDVLIDKFSNGPRRVLGLPEINIEEGAIANLTLFDPNIVWTVDDSKFLSKSINNPFTGKELKGKAIAVLNNDQFHICS